MSSNPNELRAERYEHLQLADKLIQSAMDSRKDLGGADLSLFNAHVARMREIDAALDKYEKEIGPRVMPLARDRSFPRNPRGTEEPFVPMIVGNPDAGNDVAPTIGFDGEGGRVPIFNKGQSIVAFSRQEQGRGSDSEVTLGGLARAMVLGGGTPAVRAALAEGSDSAGGVTVPVLLSSQLIDALRAKSTVFTAGARTVLLDSLKTTIAAIASDPQATWRAENSDVALSDMTFAPVTFNAKSLAVIVTASQELLEDSLNLNQALMMSLAAAFAAELDRVALLGSGTGSEPKGVSKVAGIGSYSMGVNGAALSDYSPFIEALDVLQTANASAPTAAIMHPRTNREINLLKDSTGQPLHRPKAIEELPFLVTSKVPINETQGSSNSASRVVMGNFEDLMVGIRHHLRIELLRERYADKLQIGFLAHLRADVAVAHAASFVNIVGIN